MLVPLTEVLKQAEKGGPGNTPSAVASLNIVDFDMVRALLAAAEELRSPVIISVATRHWKQIDAPALAPSIRELCRRADVPVTLHLDHASKTQIDIIEAALEAGFTSVMIDGSKEEYDENLRITREVTAMAHARGVSVEGELGAVGGEEGVAEYVDAEVHGQADSGTAAAGDGRPEAGDGEKNGTADTREPQAPYTDPVMARKFVEASRIDALAVAVGTAHGFYKSEPRIRLDLISRIAENCPVPLVMHGASGIPSDTIRASIARGIRKINYFSGFMVRAMETVRESSRPESNDYLGLRNRLMAAWQDEAKKQIRLYRG
jgi:fructose-bisphosphate aldolase class II